MKAGTWRQISDYVGAGRFVLTPERLVVGTEYGAQCLPNDHTSLKDWKTQLGSRCISLRETDGDTILATCTGGVFQLSAEGEVQRELLVAEDLVHEAVPVNGGLLFASRTALHYRSEWSVPGWDFDFREDLGRSVQSTRLINLFTDGDRLVVGAVDYDSGLGRVFVLDREGKTTWKTDLCPLSELFPAGPSVLVWSVTGYGKFETHMSRLDGQEIWCHDFAGVGAVQADGCLAMLVGSNESPKWDNWEYRRIAPDGREELVLQARGRCPVRPFCHEDGSVFFIGSAFYLDPASSRVDYTNFFKMPQELIFQHLVGIYLQTPEYDVYVQKLPAGGDKLEVVYNVTGSFSLAEPRMLGKHIVFCDGTDLVGVEV